MTTDRIEYEITLKVTIPAGTPEDAPRPFEPEFYAVARGCVVEVMRAQRITPGTSYGGAR